MNIAGLDNGCSISLNCPKSAFENGKSNYHLTIRYTDDTGYYELVFRVPYNGNNIPVGKVVSEITVYNDEFAQFRVRGRIGVFEIKGSNSIVLESVNFTTQYTSYQNSVGLYDGCIVASLNYTSIVSNNIEINADFPLFMLNSVNHIVQPPQSLDTGYYYTFDNTNYTTYANEIISGDFTHIDLAENYYSLTNTIPANKTYFILSSLKVNGTPASSKGYCFQILPDAKICLYQDESATGDGSPNLHLIISAFPCLVKDYDDPDEDYVESSNPDSEYWHSGYWKDLDTGVNYTGICSTNIPIFRGQENAQKYLNGELSETDALNGGSFSNTDSSIGEELTASDIPTISLATSGVGSFAYALSGAQLTEIMEDYLYTSDTNLQDTMKDALWAWGNNPIDFLIDCYYVPFSITHFYDTINANLKFGSYQFPNTSYPSIKETNGNRLVLFNTTFEGVYGDWRDFTQFNYDLFLPFIGFVPLDVQKYLNKQVRCEMMFDITTHNLRYYLFVDNKITDRFDGSVGINIPLMATDIVNKAKHDRDIRYGLVSDALSAGTQVGMAVTSADFGGMATGLVGGINTIVNGVKKYQELNNRATSGVHGSFSSSMNVYDISYAYLRITERQMILPSGLNSIYNFPSYYMGTLNQLTGYCEIDDIQLKSNCTESEYNEIKNLLKGGVIF